MIFTRVPGKPYEESGCKKYTVARTGPPGDYLFGAWKVGKPDVLLGHQQLAEDARDLCRADALKAEA